MKIPKKVLRILLFSLTGFVLLLALAATYFYINKDRYTKNLLLEANSYVPGEIMVDEVTIDPLVHFPKIALELREVLLFEHKKKEGEHRKDTIIRIEELDVSFDIIKLLKSELEITEISALNGHIHLIQDTLGIYNIAKAIQQPTDQSPQEAFISTDSVVATPKNDSTNSTAKKKLSGSPEKQKSNQTKSSEQQENNAHKIYLDIDEIDLSNMAFHIEMKPINQVQSFNIDKTEAQFKYIEDSVEVKLESSLHIKHLALNTNAEIEDESLLADIEFNYHLGNQFLKIQQGNLEFKHALFDLYGEIGFADAGSVDMEFQAQDKDLAFTRLFLTNEGIDNLKKGQLYLKGQARGSFEEQIPVIQLDFGIADMTLEMPKSGHYIRNFNMKGHLNSGNKQNFSRALLRVDTLHALLPTGHIRAAATVQNFLNPKILYDLDASFQLDHLGKYFHLGPLQGLRGGVEVKDRYRGSIIEGIPQIDRDTDSFNIQLDSISFSIPEVIDINLLDGELSGNLDLLQIDSLVIRSGDSDLLINGTLNEISNMAFDQNTLFRTDLSIKSGIFDFPLLFRALPRTAKSFPYTIRDVSIDLTAETSFQNLNEFQKIPRINFEIKKVTAKVDSLLNFVELVDGKFEMSENENAYFLDFKDFKLISEGVSSEVEFLFAEKMGQLDSLSVYVNTPGINLSRLLDQQKDSLPGIAEAEMSGIYRGYMLMPKHDSVYIEKAILDISNFGYIARDTVRASSFNAQLADIRFSSESSEAFWTSLHSKNDLYFKDLQTPLFQSDSLGLYIDTEDGVLRISPHDHESIGKNESGSILIYPFEDPPRYTLNYQIDDLPLHDFLASFYEQELLYGDVDVNLQLQAEGLEEQDITSSLTGSIYVVGDSLKLKGLNLDDVIKDFQRSQSFNLVDLGAVALAGPAGIVYSKGSNYVALLSVDKQDSTLISKFSSKWLLDSGRISVDDVAFATMKNRVAATGWMDMQTDSLDMTIAVIDQKGCAIFDQRIFGNAEAPEYGKVKFLKTLLAPVTNAIKGAVGAKCEIVYDGIVSHPQASSKKNKN